MHNSKSRDPDSKFMENAEPDVAPHKIIANPQPFCSLQVVGHLEYANNMLLPTDHLYLRLIEVGPGLSQPVPRIWDHLRQDPEPSYPCLPHNQDIFTKL